MVESKNNLGEPLLPQLSSGFKTLWKAQPSPQPTEALDYEPINSAIHLDSQQEQNKSQKKQLYGYTGRTVLKIIMTLLTGVLTGLFAVLVQQSIRIIIEKRNFVMFHLPVLMGGQVTIFRAYIKFVAYSVILITSCAAMVQYWSPKSAGAGASVVIAYLNGNYVKDLLSMRTLVSKTVGTILSVASGLPFGPEAPMVHIGSCIANTIPTSFCDFHRNYVLYKIKKEQKGRKDIESFIDERTTDQMAHDHSTLDLNHQPYWMGLWGTIEMIASNDVDMRDLVSAGAAAGLSAAFGAPIGGVIFALEEMTSFWTKKTMWRCFISAVTSSFVTSQITGNGSAGFVDNIFVLKPMEFREWRAQLPLLFLCCCCTGLLGVLFNVLRLALWKVRPSRRRSVARIAECGYIAAIGITCYFTLARFVGSCIPIKEDYLDSKLPVQFNCQEGYYNDLATIFFQYVGKVTELIYSLKTEIFLESFSISSMLVYSLINVVLLSLISGVAAPGGLFMPAIGIGAVFGGAFAQILRTIWPESTHDQNIYAILGSAAMLSGVFKSSISVVVIMVEGTKGINLIFGVIMAVMTANLIMALCRMEGIYESEIERDHYVYYLANPPPRRLRFKPCSEVMATDVVCIHEIESVHNIITVLKNTSHNGFPVVSRDTMEQVTGKTSHRFSVNQAHGRLEGLILRKQLLVILQRQAYCDAQGNPKLYNLSDTVDDGNLQRAIQIDSHVFYKRYHPNRLAQASQVILNSIIEQQHEQSGQLTREPSQQDIFDPSKKVDSDDQETSSQVTSSIGNNSNSGSLKVSFGAASYPPQPFLGELDKRKPALDQISEHAEPTKENKRLQQLYSIKPGTESKPEDGRQPLQISAQNSVESPLSVDIESGRDRFNLVDLRPFMNKFPLTVRAETPVSRAYTMFLQMGLRHLCCVDKYNELIGIITRKDLDAAAAHGHAKWTRKPPTNNNGQQAENTFRKAYSMSQRSIHQQVNVNDVNEREEEQPNSTLVRTLARLLTQGQDQDVEPTL